MANFTEAYANGGGASADYTLGFAPPADDNSLGDSKANPLDNEQSRTELNILLNWFYWEKEMQAVNRMEMAMDADFYDGMQWLADDAQTLRSRGQMPLVYNEIAPVVDWLIGTQRRASVDWDVLPRNEQDVQTADIKTKVLKYVSDINKIDFARSRAFADAIKVGVGWIDDGVREDPTKDILYSKYEDWRNVLWDSRSNELDLQDARYVFRWRWVDLDVALAMFPDREDAIREAAYAAPRMSMGSDEYEDTTDGLQTGQLMTTTSSLDERAGVIFAAGSAPMGTTRRQRVRLIECQYLKAAKTQIVQGGPFHGSFYHPSDTTLTDSINATGATIIDKVMMRMHVAVMTENRMLGYGPSRFRHNRFGLTPVWCYRRGRDHLPYGMIRRLRDIQEDMNKRASKALFLLNTNQIIAEKGAVDDLNMLRDEADRPDGMIITNSGKTVTIRRDTDAASGQINMMTLAAQAIQRHSGVSDENLGRQTNANSGVAIQARQMAGSVVTTEPFDNLRLAIQVQGEKLLSLVEQFYTDAKVVRLTGTTGGIEWTHVNSPEIQADGSIRYINDITATAADFVVSEQDYAGTIRQVMFTTLSEMATRLPPEIALRVLTMAISYSDLPNKDDMVREIRQMTGAPDPSAQLTPEEQQQQQQAQKQQQAQQAQAMQMQQQAAVLALQEQTAKVREVNAKAAQLEAQTQGANGGAGNTQAFQDQIMQIRAQASQEIESLQAKLQQTTAEANNKTMQITSDANTKLEIAKIAADAQIRVAEITRASDTSLAAMAQRIKVLEASVTGSGNVPAADLKQPPGAAPVPVQGTVAPEPAIPSTPPNPGA
jgi:hypothetical protein